MSKDVDRILGARVRLIRIARGKSQQAVAGALGVTFQQIQKYEKGVNRISASTLVELARELSVHVSDFFVDVEGQGGRPASPQTPFAFADDPQAIRLAHAFSAIPNKETRKQVLNLVTSLA